MRHTVLYISRDRKQQDDYVVAIPWTVLQVGKLMFEEVE